MNPRTVFYKNSISQTYLSPDYSYLKTGFGKIWNWPYHVLKMFLWRYWNIISSILCIRSLKIWSSPIFLLRNFKDFFKIYPKTSCIKRCIVRVHIKKYQWMFSISLVGRWVDSTCKNSKSMSHFAIFWFDPLALSPMSLTKNHIIWSECFDKTRKCHRKHEESFIYVTVM